MVCVVSWMSVWFLAAGVTGADLLPALLWIGAFAAAGAALVRVRTAPNPALCCMGLLTALMPTILLFMSVNIYFFVPLVAGLGCAVTGLVEMRETARRTATAIGLVLCLAAAVG